MPCPILHRHRQIRSLDSFGEALEYTRQVVGVNELKGILSGQLLGLAYRSLAVAYMLLGREKSAIQAYEKFVEVMPSHRDAPKVKQIIADYHQRNP